MTNKFSAQDIYDVMHKDAKPRRILTEQQARAVEGASLSSASLVVAGAGSGKTELMAVRVLWLVANGHALPEQILGLTFTRKAANELNKRIYQNLLTLRDRKDMWPEELGEDFAQPNIATYNSYANSLFKDFALGLGYEAESTLLTDAGSFQLAREVLIRDGAKIEPKLGEIDSKIDAITEHVISLAASLNDNLVSGDQVVSEIETLLESWAELKPHSAKSGEMGADFRSLTDSLKDTLKLAPLAEHYRNEKQRMGYVDYSDQVVLAEKAARLIPDVVIRENQRYKHILLDEYQDTSVLQTKLLSTIFVNKAVLAVGDPNQSIYGWRGASAANLATFSEDFTGKSGAVETFALPTSWRNPTSVLAVANKLAEPLKSAPSYQTSAPSLASPVELLAKKDAKAGSVSVEFLPDLVEEAKSVAEWFAAKLEDQPNAKAALLMRKRSNMKLFKDQLEKQGVTVDVIGLGGLLDEPEIIDLVSALKVIHSPDSGSELIRLLAGPRWRIGPADLNRLYEFATRINKLRFKAEEAAHEDSASLVDALDYLTDPSNSNMHRIEEPALSRLIDAGELFAKLRTQTGLPLPQFVRMVEQELWLDIELLANPSKKFPMANLNKFASIVSSYSSSNHRPYLGAFIQWLDFADQHEQIEVPVPKPQDGVVQIMTIHAAKGLEWDFVAVSNLVNGDFPDNTKGASGWLTRGALPWTLRGDRGSLPTFNCVQPKNQTAVTKALEAFKDLVREHHEREERRLMYVAVTRPMQELLLTGSYFKPKNKDPRVPSKFLVEAVQLREIVEVIGSPTGELPENLNKTNPLDEIDSRQTWPLDPLGERHRIDVERAASQVVEYQVDAEKRKRVIGSLFEDIDLLLQEEDERHKTLVEVELPVRVSASKFKDFVSDADNEIGRQLRPVPGKPYAETLAGTLFHGIMEQRFARKAALGDVDFDVVDVYVPDLAKHKQIIDELDANFAKSRWANREPKHAEIEIQVAVDANIFVCKLDAVFESDDPNFEVEIVDWKTGKPPVDEDDLKNRSLQLSMYRMAYARLTGIAPEKISCSLYFVQTNEEVTRNDLLLSEAELLGLWQKVAD